MNPSEYQAWDEEDKRLDRIMNDRSLSWWTRRKARKKRELMYPEHLRFYAHMRRWQKD